MHSFEADEKIITRNSSAWFVYFVSIDIPAFRLQNFFFGEAESPFLHQLKSLCDFFLFVEGESSWSTQRVVFTPLNPFTRLNNVALRIL
jgi:hypothetical protein